ncbi:MAG: ABC transporter permease [Pleurocapsa minor GSE-CHR-MK-17-07R]|jgi:peptide/nickel transport system permease protein|nr:ABC transporter permease [Pleurocapsa minor GSE-CHR-MK 17-07R]
MAATNPPATPVPAPSIVSRGWRAVRGAFSEIARRPLSLIGLVLVVFFIVLALLAPVIAPYNFDQIIRGAARQAPSAEHVFGTDMLGRDIFSRVVYGSREILAIPAATTALSLIFGASIGLFIGFRGGWVDSIISRVLDALLSIPALLLALVMLATVGSSPGGIIAVIVLLYTPIVARVTRSSVLSVRSTGYVEAARLRGESLGYILFQELLPAVLPALIVEGALRFSYAIFLTASLGFLGLGVQPPSPDWGRMVNEARDSFRITPWSLWFPTGAIALLIIGVNLLSDGLRRIFRREGQGL